MTFPELKKLRERWRNSPARFVSDVWGVKFRDKQRAVLDAFCQKNHHAKVAWRAYRGAGKTTVEAWLALYHCCMYDDAVVVMTSATFRQVKEMQWREIGKQFRLAQRRGLTLGPEPQTTQWNAKADSFAIGLSCRDPNNIEGFHAKHVLVILDEAKAVSDAVFRATFGYESTAKTCKVLCASAAGKNVGFFFDRFKTPDWIKFHSDGERSKDCSRTWIAMMARELGVKSAYYRAQVKAEFYEEDESTLIAFHLLDLARRGGGDDCEPQKDDENEVGVDVGAGGDLSAICLRRGPRFFHGETLKRENTMETVGAVMALHHRYKIAKATVDAAGVGVGVADRIGEQGIRAVKYFAGGGASDKKRFLYRRSEDAYGLRERFTQQLADFSDMPEDFWLRFAGQANTIKLVRNSLGQYVLENKDAYKRRMSEVRGKEFARSPDEFDSVCYCNAPDRGLGPAKDGEFDSGGDRENFDAAGYEPPGDDDDWG